MRRPDLAMVEGQILPEPYNVFASCNADSGSGRSNRPSLRQTGPVCRRGDLHICGCLVPAGIPPHLSHPRFEEDIGTGRRDDVEVLNEFLAIWR
jgi:hypothetical protein